MNLVNLTSIAIITSIDNFYKIFKRISKTLYKKKHLGTAIKIPKLVYGNVGPSLGGVGWPNASLLPGKWALYGTATMLGNAFYLGILSIDISSIDTASMFTHMIMSPYLNLFAIALK